MTVLTETELDKPANARWPDLTVREVGLMMDDAERYRALRALRAPLADFNQFEAAIMDMAKSYVLGSPESRAVITALEHARIVTGRAPQPQLDGEDRG